MRCDAVRAGLTINLLFPIKDEPSAKLMSLKAERLCAAGVIDVVEKRNSGHAPARLQGPSLTQLGHRPARIATNPEATQSPPRMLV